jgi:hypothetical protein
MGTLLDFKRSGKVRVNISGGRPTVEEVYEVRVEASSKYESLESIYGTPGLPKIGQQKSGILICKSVELTRHPQIATYYEGTVTFSSDVDASTSTGGGGDFDPQGDPATWVPVYETRFERLQEVVTEDRSDPPDPVVNSAGQHFQTGLTVSRHIPIWTFYQFEAPVSDEVVIARHETVNDALFKGRAAKTLLCIVESSVIGFYYGKRRRLTQYSLKYNDRDWTHKRLDIGTYYLDSGDRKTFTTDDTGAAIAGPLNGSGGKAATSADVAVLSFDIYTEADFSSFLIT